jgi:hypothetical protein
MGGLVGGAAISRTASTTTPSGWQYKSTASL